MSLPDVLRSTYGDGFRFYGYASFVFDLLEAHHPGRLRALFDAGRSGRKETWDAVIADMSSDPALSAAYQAHLEDRIGAIDDSNARFAEDVPTSRVDGELGEGGAAEIDDVLRPHAPSGEGSLGLAGERWVFRGSATVADVGGDALVAASRLEHFIDRVLDLVEPAGPNFATAVAWFGDVKLVEDHATATWVVDGPYRPGAADGAPPATPVGLTLRDTGGSVLLRWTPNEELDLAGYHVYLAAGADGPFERWTTGTLTEPRAWVEPGSSAAAVERYRVRAIDAGGLESEPSEAVEVRAPVLVVNGYYEPGRLEASDDWSRALRGLGVRSARWDPFEDGRAASEVLGEMVDGVVIWAVGYSSSDATEQLGPARQQAWIDYLGAGGAFILSGAYAVHGLDGSVVATDWLGFRSDGWGTAYTSLLGVDGNPATDGLTLEVSTSYQAEMSAIGPGQPALTFDPASGTGPTRGQGLAGVTVDEGYRAFSLSFPVDRFGEDDRRALLQGTLRWMLPDICLGADGDGDRQPDLCDVCDPGDDFADSDLDGVPDACDVCPDANDAVGCTRCEAGYDLCDICAGDGRSCVGCDGIAHSGWTVDDCGICGGNGSTCAGCDGVPNSGKVLDECEVCGGNGSTCAGCDGRPHSGKVLDGCGVCGGDGSTCAGCDGVPRSGKLLDTCGVCGGDGSSCAMSSAAPQQQSSSGGCNGAPAAPPAGPWPTFVALTAWLVVERRRRAAAR